MEEKLEREEKESCWRWSQLLVNDETDSEWKAKGSIDQIVILVTDHDDLDSCWTLMVSECWKKKSCLIAHTKVSMLVLASMTPEVGPEVRKFLFMERK